VAPAVSAATEAPATLQKDKIMNAKLSPTLLTPETSLVLILDYQKHVLDGIHSDDHDLIELNGRALARATKVFKVPVILSTIGVKLRGDPATLPSIRADLADEPEYDRNTMNAWEDKTFREAVEKTGRKRLIFAGLWTEVCLLYPVLHAQRDGFETYFVSDAVGGSTSTAHDTAIQRMIQAGSQPLTVNSMLTEWIRDWGTTPYLEDFTSHMQWYGPEIEKIRTRLRTYPYQADIA
jgi:nicotinamidase-related amidase